MSIGRKFVVWERVAGSNVSWTLRMGRYLTHQRALDAIRDLKRKYAGMSFTALPDGVEPAHNRKAKADR